MSGPLDSKRRAALSLRLIRFQKNCKQGTALARIGAGTLPKYCLAGQRSRGRLESSCGLALSSIRAAVLPTVYHIRYVIWRRGFFFVIFYLFYRKKKVHLYLCKVASGQQEFNARYNHGKHYYYTTYT